MTLARLRSLALFAMPIVIAGAILGIATGLIGGAGGLAVAVVGVVVIAVLGPRLFARYVAPGLLRVTLQRMTDAGELPPASAQPVELPLAGRYAAAVEARDWAALAELVDPILALFLPGSHRRYGRKHFLKSARVTAEAYPDLRVRIEEVRVDPASPEVAWVRILETGRPRIGAPLRASWWERWTLGPDGLTVRELALGRVVELDETAA